MPLDDLIDDKKKEQEKSEVDKLMDELGVEDKEDLELTLDRVRRLSIIVTVLEKKVEMLEDDMNELIKDVRKIKDELDEEDSPWL